MKIAQVERFVIKTRMSPEKVVETLKANTEPKKLFRLEEISAKYEGEVSQAYFEIIHRYKHGEGYEPPLYIIRRPTPPLISGEIQKEADGSIISVDMRSGQPSKAFLTLFIGSFTVFFTMLLTSVLPGGSYNWAIIAPVTGVFLGWTASKFSSRTIASDTEHFRTFVALVQGELLEGKLLNN